MATGVCPFRLDAEDTDEFVTLMLALEGTVVDVVDEATAAAAAAAAADSVLAFMSRSPKPVE